MRRGRKDNTRRNQIMIGIVLVFLMVMSGFGIMSRSGQDSIWYGKYKFQVSQDRRFLFLEYNDRDVEFYNHPDNVRNLTDGRLIKSKLQDKDYLIVTFDPEQSQNNLAVVDKLRFDLENTFPITVIPGVTKETEEYGFLVFDCENSSAFIPVIYMSESNETSVEVQGDCILASGTASGLIQFRDFLLFSMIGVLDEEVKTE